MSTDHLDAPTDVLTDEDEARLVHFRTWLAAASGSELADRLPTAPPTTPLLSAAPPPPPMSRSNRRRRQWMAWMLALAALLGIGGLVLRRLNAPTDTEANLAEGSGPVSSIAQVPATAPSLSADITDQLAKLAKAWTVPNAKPVVLSYHDISPDGTSPYAVRPAQFAEQMAALNALGAHTVTAAEFAQYLQGRPLPPRSVMITFDDGTRGVWQYADSILALYKFHAIGFVVTSFVGTNPPYYMTWPELERLAASGRWDFENHTAEGHVRMVIDDRGGEGAYLSHLAWLPQQRRVETIQEYQRRVAADLDRAAAELRSHKLAASRLFAFPFSDAGPSGQDSAVARTLHNILTSRFVAVFNDDAAPLALQGPFQFNRLSIAGETTAKDLIQKIGKVVELTVAAGDSTAKTTP